MQGIRKLAQYRVSIARVTLLYNFVFLLWRGCCHLLPSQLKGPVLGKVHYDLAFWLFKLSGLDNIIVHHAAGAVFFSFSVIALCVASILCPKKRVFIIPFTLCYFLLAVIFNIYLCHSAHYLGGMVWLSLAFWPAKDDNFDMLWEGMRYYACWIYASAFLWKVLNGAFFQWDAGALTFKMNLAQYLYQDPGTFFAGIYYYFLQHPALLNAGHKIVALAEGVFLIGFFTKKYDVLLIFCAVFIFASIYFFSDVFFAELLVIIFPLLPGRTWVWINDKIPFLNKEISFLRFGGNPPD